MSDFSKGLADALANHIFRNTQHTSPSAVFVALHDAGGSVVADPSDIQATADDSELTYTSYVRQEATFGAPTGTDDAVVANTGVLVFPAVDTGEGPVEVTGISLWDAETSGNMLCQFAVDAVKEFADGDAPTIRVGELEFTID